MTQNALPTACPDCSGTMREITLFGRSSQNPISGAAIDAAVVYYTDAEAARSTLMQMFNVEGEVRSLMCRECGRLFLYGVPKPDEDAPSAEQFECLQCGTLIEAGQLKCTKCGWSYAVAQGPV